eukprot:TRINITY_DN51761_c0_g1_i1.p1 TRINITY_DN51761_c0_g1~~TRINITY_DN51761_c0_g1_i1.p1  ORF type:complete len:578 (-),score=46.18 TRINITY_DN51761_c0_g1_i1:255-1988(-)
MPPVDNARVRGGGRGATALLALPVSHSTVVHTSFVGRQTPTLSEFGIANSSNRQYVSSPRVSTFAATNGASATLPAGEPISNPVSFNGTVPVNLSSSWPQSARASNVNVSGTRHESFESDVHHQRLNAVGSFTAMSTTSGTPTSMPSPTPHAGGTLNRRGLRSRPGRLGPGGSSAASWAGGGTWSSPGTNQRMHFRRMPRSYPTVHTVYAAVPNGSGYPSIPTTPTLVAVESRFGQNSIVSSGYPARFLALVNVADYLSEPGVAASHASGGSVQPQRRYVLRPSRTLRRVEGSGSTDAPLCAVHTHAPPMLSNDDCAICLEAFKTGELVQPMVRCQHVFHETCVRALLHARQPATSDLDVAFLTDRIVCPLCRGHLATSSILDLPEQERTFAVHLEEFLGHTSPSFPSPSTPAMEHVSLGSTVDMGGRWWEESSDSARDGSRPHSVYGSSQRPHSIAAASEGALDGFRQQSLYTYTTFTRPSWAGDNTTLSHSIDTAMRSPSANAQPTVGLRSIGAQRSMTDGQIHASGDLISSVFADAVLYDVSAGAAVANDDANRRRGAQRRALLRPLGLSGTVV